MNMLVDNEWNEQFRLKNYGTHQEKLDAEIWLVEYAEKRVRDIKAQADKDEHEKT